MLEIEINPRSPELFAPVIGADRGKAFVDALAQAKQLLGGHTVWHVNSTATGGGVAEMLQSVLAYPKGAGIDVHWLVAEGNDAFFGVTKRIHNLLHGSAGDGGPLGEEERRIYEAALAPEIDALLERVVRDDVVILHDPQTLGLASALSVAGARVIWACHVGADTANAQTRQVWDFLLPYVECTEAQCFSRAQYRWEGLEEATCWVIPPCIDAFAPKNEDLDEAHVTAILDAAGIVPSSHSVAPTFTRLDGGESKVERKARMIESAPIPANVPIVCQISRWDPLKDHEGIMASFAGHLAVEHDAHLILAGPAPEAVADDPEGKQTLEDLIAAWEALDDEVRTRVHLCCVPMDDLEENAAIINALQRRSDVVVQKSLAEGFGLTVAEAMWKGRPTLGSRVGGIQDQIEDEESGRLVDAMDPEDFAAALSELLSDRDEAVHLGKVGRQRVLEEYLVPSYLTRQFELVETVLSGVHDRRG